MAPRVPKAEKTANETVGEQEGWKEDGNGCFTMQRSDEGIMEDAAVIAMGTIRRSHEGEEQEDEGMNEDVQVIGVNDDVSLISDTNMDMGQTTQRKLQRKRSRVGEREEEGGCIEGTIHVKKFGINKTLQEVRGAVRKLAKVSAKNKGGCKDLDDLLNNLTTQVLDMSTEMLNGQAEKAALMDQIIGLQQVLQKTPVVGAINIGMGASTYSAVAQKGMSRAVAAGTCLPPPVLPEATKHVPAEQVILYKAEVKGTLPTKSEQEKFRGEMSESIGKELMGEVSAIRSTRYGGYTIIFRTEKGRDEAMQKIYRSTDKWTEEEKRQRIVAPKKKMAKIVCREPPANYSFDQILADFYGRHNPLLSQVAKINRKARIFETRLGWIFEVSACEAAAVEGQGNRIRYGFGREMRVEEFIPLQQCYRCYLFGHNAKECSSQSEHCRLCGMRGHSGKDCQQRDNRSAGKCANCIWNNKNRGTRLPVDHAAAQLHRCAIAQNEKVIWKSQLATSGVFVVPQKPFVPKISSGTEGLEETRNNTVMKEVPSAFPTAPTATSTNGRRRAPSLQLARCYVPPASSSASVSSTSSSSATKGNNEIIQVRPAGVPLWKNGQPARGRVSSRGVTGRGRGRETYENKNGGTNSMEGGMQHDTSAFTTPTNTNTSIVQGRGNNAQQKTIMTQQTQ